MTKTERYITVKHHMMNCCFAWAYLLVLGVGCDIYQKRGDAISSLPTRAAASFTFLLVLGALCLEQVKHKIIWPNNVLLTWLIMEIKSRPVFGPNILLARIMYERLPIELT